MSRSRKWNAKSSESILCNKVDLQSCLILKRNVLISLPDTWSNAGSLVTRDPDWKNAPVSSSWSDSRSSWRGRLPRYHRTSPRRAGSEKTRVSKLRTALTGFNPLVCSLSTLAPSDNCPQSHAAHQHLPVSDLVASTLRCNHTLSQSWCVNIWCPIVRNKAEQHGGSNETETKRLEWFVKPILDARKRVFFVSGMDHIRKPPKMTKASLIGSNEERDVKFVAKHFFISRKRWRNVFVVGPGCWALTY